MIKFFGNPSEKIFAVQVKESISDSTIEKLTWLFGNQPPCDAKVLPSTYVGPRAAMITPWSTNAVEISQNMGIIGIERIEQFYSVEAGFNDFDPMLSQKYSDLNQDIFTIKIEPASIKEIEDIELFNREEGLALNKEEVDYLNDL